MSRYLAVPFTPEPAAKLDYLLTRLAEHETWWSDYTRGRREAADAVLSNPNNIIFEVWALADAKLGAQPAGIVLFTDIIAGVDAKCHFIFFDAKLKSKTPLLRNMMAWAFGTLRLHRLSAEIPDYAFALAKYAREQLGFRYEAEGRTLQQRDERTRTEGRPRLVDMTLTGWQASWGSRRYQVVRWKGAWHDLLLLGITEEEFAALETTDGCSSGSSGHHGGQQPPR